MHFRAGLFKLGSFFALTALLLLPAACKTQDMYPVNNGAVPEGNRILSIGVAADCQYTDKHGNFIVNRYYARSKERLIQCMEELNALEPDFVVHLGDLIDRDYASYDEILPVFDSLNAPLYHVLGNHDYSVSEDRKDLVPARLGVPAPYYDFVQNGWRFIVLDGNEISFFASPEGSGEYEEARAYFEENSIKSPKWNGAIGPDQLRWLEEVLERATAAEEQVILFCHFPVFPDNVHNLWNAGELIELFERYPCVKAYMNGHNHAGNYAIKNGIHYVTFKGMVDTEDNSYATISVEEGSLNIIGVGRETDRTLQTSQDSGTAR